MSYLDDPKLQQTIAKLKEIRVRTELKAPPSKILRTTMPNGRPLTLRNYQVQGIMHLLAMPRFVLGDDTGLGKTLQAISALSYLWDKYPETSAVIMTTKSALNQWASEFDKFTNGVKCFVVSGDKKKRQKVYDDYFAHTGLKVLIMGYRTACMDFETLQNLKDHVQIFDEATAFKNETTQVHQVCAHLSGAAQKVWSLSATIIKNRLMEAWAIYRVTVPGLMPSKNVFMSNYCICVDKQIGRKRIKFVVGHRKSDIEAFRIKIDPYFIGRPKHEVAQELPPLTTKRIEAPLSDVQISKYKEALSGILEKYDPTTGEMTEK